MGGLGTQGLGTQGLGTHPNGIVIVGAGIVGCLAAREAAARFPGMPVTVLDRDTVGAGTSSRSAGLHLLRGRSERQRRMSAFSHAYYADLRRGHPVLPIYPVAATVVTNDSIDRYLRQATPTPVTATTTEAVALPAGSSAWGIDGSHYCDVYRLTQELASQLRPRVAFGEGIAVTDLACHTDGVRVGCGTGRWLAAAALILAPGPWLAAPAWRDLVAPLGLRVKRIVALHIERPPAPGDETVLFDADDAFLLPLAHRGHWLFSYSCDEWDVDPDGPVTGLTGTHLKVALDCLRRYSPVLADACVGGRVGCDAYSPDREPVIAPLDAAGRIVFAGAACGSGYRLAPAIAAEAVDHLAQLSKGVNGDLQQV